MFALYQPSLFSSDFGVGLFTVAILLVQNCFAKIIKAIEISKKNTE